MDIKKIMGCFEYFFGNFNPENYEHRVAFQKFVYLLRDKFTNEYKDYGWHLRGPYSYDLTDDLFKHKKTGEEHTLPNEKEKRFLDTLKEKVLSTTNDQIEKTNRIELYGSLLYLLDKHSKLPDSELVEKMHTRKPWYTIEEIQKAIITLRKIYQR